jgi:hypothetical protein
MTCVIGGLTDFYNLYSHITNIFMVVYTDPILTYLKMAEKGRTANAGKHGHKVCLCLCLERDSNLRTRCLSGPR